MCSKKNRLCISKVIKQKIFRMIHDFNNHENFYRTYDKLINSIYVRHLTKRLRIYIEHCSKWQIHQIKRHFLRQFAINRHVDNSFSHVDNKLYFDFIYRWRHELCFYDYLQMQQKAIDCIRQEYLRYWKLNQCFHHYFNDSRLRYFEANYQRQKSKIRFFLLTYYFFTIECNFVNVHCLTFTNRRAIETNKSNIENRFAFLIFKF